MKTPNEKTVTVKMTRHELCDIILACTMLDRNGDHKWSALHDKLREQLDAHDAREAANA